jgi:ABC-type sugar transport system substrate-binding protein
VEKQLKGNKILTRNILVMKTSLLRALATAACNFIVCVSHSLSSAPWKVHIIQVVAAAGKKDG